MCRWGIVIQNVLHFCLGWWMVPDVSPVPLPVAAMWTFLVAGTLYGSFPFAFEQMEMVRKQFSGQTEEATASKKK